MKDVAREAGVSLGTVSKVFNGIRVGEEYRRKVLQAADTLHYQVNSYARSLKTNRSNSIALLIPTLKHPFFAALADEITASLSRRGLRLILFLTNYDLEAEQTSLTLVRQHKADGVIGLTYHPDLVIDGSIPFVSIDRRFNAAVPCVSSDNFQGGQIAAQKLIENGCRRLLYLRIGSYLAVEVNKRQTGFEDVCRRSGIPWDSQVLDDRTPVTVFYAWLRGRIKNGRLPYDGIFCNSDLLAGQIVSFLRSEGIAVPSDVQVIGYDGIPDFFTGSCVCSTIVQPLHEMAETAVDLITASENIQRPVLICLPVKYAPSGTTRDPSTRD